MNGLVEGQYDVLHERYPGDVSGFRVSRAGRHVRSVCHLISFLFLAPFTHPVLANDGPWSCFAIEVHDAAIMLGLPLGSISTKTIVENFGVYETPEAALNASIGRFIDFYKDGSERSYGYACEYEVVDYSSASYGSLSIWDPEAERSPNVRSGCRLGINGAGPVLQAQQISGPDPFDEDLSLQLAQTCGNIFRVELSNDDPVSGGQLSEIQPHGSAPRLRATVYNESGNRVPFMNVELSVEAVENSGGHQHHAGRPNGTLQSFSGVYGKPSSGKTVYGQTLNVADEHNGSFSFSFKAPAPAGDHKIKARCIGQHVCTQGGPDTVWVGYRDIVPMPSSENYVFVGDTTEHTDNHHLTAAARAKVAAIAEGWFTLDPSVPELRLNDASLERGGVFDLKQTWRKPHQCHSRGYGIDIRANGASDAIPQGKFENFRKIVAQAGARAVFEPAPPHFHVYLIPGGCEPR